jgi:hypothetical protein
MTGKMDVRARDMTTRQQINNVTVSKQKIDCIK